MEIKEKKGITLVALVITVVIMLILIGVGVKLGTDIIDKAKLEDIKTDMISIKTKAKIVVDEYNYKDIESLVGSEISEEEIKLLGLSDKPYENIRKWSKEDLAMQNLSTIEGDKYVVYYDLENPNNCEVYYLEGYKDKYSLTELQEN